MTCIIYKKFCCELHNSFFLWIYEFIKTASVATNYRGVFNLKFEVI